MFPLSRTFRNWLGPILLLACLSTTRPALGGETETESLALAALLVRDGQWDRARSVLASIPEDADEADSALYFTTQGLLALHDQEGTAAAEAFRSAITRASEEEDAPESALLYLYLAQAWSLAGESQLALEALNLAEDREKDSASGWIMRIQIERAAGEQESAWESSRMATAAFPEDFSIGQMQVDILGTHGLFLDAREVALDWIMRPTMDADGAIQLIGILRAHGALDAAWVVAETSRFRFPDVLDIWLAGAQVATERGRSADAAHYLQSAATLDPSYAIQAAEAFRQSGQSSRALYMNSMAADSPEKARQRMALLLEEEEYTRAIALESRLSRHELLSEDPIRYGLAYAYYQNGRYEDSESWLTGISDPDIFRQATRLRAAIVAAQSR